MEIPLFREEASAAVAEEVRQRTAAARVLERRVGGGPGMSGDGRGEQYVFCAVR